MFWISFIWWEITIWKAVRNALWRSSNTVWSNGSISPISAEDLSRLHQFGPKVMPGIFLGYALYAEWIWKGDIMVTYIEELEEMDASELHARRLNAKDVLTPMKGESFKCPVADGTIKIFGWEQRLRKSTFTRERPERGEEQEILRGKSNGLSSPNPLHEDSTRDDEGAKSDFWTVTGDFIFRHLFEPRVELYVPREESFPIPLKYIDVTRTTKTSLDVLLEKNIEDYWQVDGEKELSDAWTGFTRFILLNKRPPDGYAWFDGETDEETNNLSSRQCMARNVEAYVWCSEKESKTKMGYRETIARQCQKSITLMRLVGPMCCSFRVVSLHYLSLARWSRNCTDVGWSRHTRRQVSCGSGRRGCCCWWVYGTHRQTISRRNRSGWYTPPVAAAVWVDAHE